MSIPTKFVVHGWLGGLYGGNKFLPNRELKEEDGWMHNTSTIWADKENSNVCSVDWSRLSNYEYAIAAMVNTEMVAKHMIAFMNFLITEGMDIKRVGIAGHSLGAQIAGKVGRYYQGLIDAIYGNESSNHCFVNFPLIFMSINRNGSGWARFHSSMGLWRWWSSKRERCELRSMHTHLQWGTRHSQGLRPCEFRRQRRSRATRLRDSILQPCAFTWLFRWSDVLRTHILWSQMHRKDAPLFLQILWMVLFKGFGTIGHLRTTESRKIFCENKECSTVCTVGSGHGRDYCGLR